MEAIKTIYHRLKLNPLHTVLGCMITAMGVTLMVNDTFFHWPPTMTWFFNNDIVDTIAILIGLGLILFVLMGGTNQMVNAMLLALSAFYLSMLIVLQLGHILIIHDYGRLLSVISLTGWIFVIEYLATHSKTVKRRK